MTGYAAVSRASGHGTLFVELRSVNARFLDLAFRITEELRGVEPQLRELVASRIERGKLEWRVNLLSEPGMQAGGGPGVAAIERLAHWQAEVLRVLPGASPLGVADVLRWPGVFAEEPGASQALHGACLDLAAQALDELLATRAREGDKLARMILDRICRMRSLVDGVAPRLPGIVEAYRDRLAARLREVLAAHDEERIRQELALFAARIDVAEELSRLTAHLDEVERVIARGGVAGKRLDFLMQELNREANTLASKSVSTELTGVALELKLLVEQMREQVQNIE